MQFSLGGQEADDDAFVEGCGNSAKHGKGVAVIVSVFEAADNRRGCPDAFGEFALTKAGLAAEIVDLASDFGIGLMFFQSSLLCRVLADVSVMEEFHGGGPCCLGLFLWVVFASDLNATCSSSAYSQFQEPNRVVTFTGKDTARTEGNTWTARSTHQ